MRTAKRRAIALAVVLAAAIVALVVTVGRADAQDFNFPSGAACTYHAATASGSGNGNYAVVGGYSTGTACTTRFTTNCVGAGTNYWTGFVTLNIPVWGEDHRDSNPCNAVSQVAAVYAAELYPFGRLCFETGWANWQWNVADGICDAP